MSVQGQVVEVRVEPRGSQLTAVAALAATSVTVTDPTPFDTDGGQVVIDDNVYAYTDVSEVDDAGEPGATNAVLTITPGLLAAQVAAEPVHLWSGTQVLDDVILSVDTGGDNPADVVVSSDLRKDWTALEGALEPPVSVLLTDDLLSVLDAPGYTPVVDGSTIDPETIPDRLPTDAPTEVLTVKVTGDALGLTAVASGDPVDQTTTLKWFIDGVLVETTRSQVYRFTLDSLGAPLAPDTDYLISVQPSNAVDDGTLSVPVPGRLNQGVSAQTVLAYVAAGFILAGAIQVGSITIDPDEGITIPLADGGLIHLPSDGTDAVITAILRARSLVVEDNLRIQGSLNAVEGGLQLANGTTAPNVLPRAGTSWDHAAAFTDTDMSSVIGSLVGLADGGGPSWYTTTNFTTGQVWTVNKTTGVRALVLAAVADYNHVGGLCRIGTDWYVLSFKNSTFEWWVRKYNSSWVFQSQWKRADNSAITGTAMVIATDGTFIYTAYRELTNGFLRVFKQDPDGTNGSTVFTSSVVPSGPVTSLYVGSADFGATRYVITTATKVYVFNSSGTRQTASEWTPANSEPIRGLVWDGTRFHTIATPSGKLWHYSTVATAASRSITHTWYDSDASGTGTHETEASPALTYSQAPRQWMRVDTDPPSFAGFPDDPDSVRIYVANQRQADLGAGITTVVYDVPATGGSAAPTSNGFAGVSAPGTLTSGASDGSGDIISLSGAGPGRTGDYAWDATGKPTSWPTIPRARASNTSTVSLTNNTLTTLALNDETAPGYDNATLHSTVTNNSRILLNQIGAWTVTARCGFAANATGRRLVCIYLNGTEIARNTTFPNASTITAVSVTETVLSATVTDYVECVAYQDSGGALSTVTAYVSLSVAYLGK